MVEDRAVHVVQSSQGATLQSIWIGARIIDLLNGDDANLIVDIRQNGTSILPLNIPMAFVPAGHIPATFSTGGTYCQGNVVTGSDGKYYWLIGNTGTYSINPAVSTLVAGVVVWKQVTMTGFIINSNPPAANGYAYPDPQVSGLNQYDFIDVAILSVFTGTYTPGSVNASGSTTTSIKTSIAGLVAGQTGTFVTGLQAGRTFTVVSGPSAGAYTVTSNMLAGPASGDLFNLNTISNVGVSTTTVIYTPIILTAGSNYTMASGLQAGRYFNVNASQTGAPSGGYLVTGNLNVGPQPGDIFGPGLVPQGLYVCLEIDESPLL